MNNSKPKILHIAQQNFAGMPIDFVKMHRDAGYESRLLTMYNSRIKYAQDIDLNLYLPQNKLSDKWRHKKFISDTTEITNAKYYEVHNIMEKLYFRLRDLKNKRKISEAIHKYNLYDFDIYHFDGGMDLFRDSRFAKKLKSMNKKIVLCYFGSDLRVRGIFKEMEAISDLNLTVEFDHLKLYKNINYIFFPFDIPEVSIKKDFGIGRMKVLHSPTNRLFKGTNKILNVINELKNEFEFDFILAENMARTELLKLKSECHLAIDTVGGISGGTGYGKNSIENLSLGLPTITEFTEDYMKFLPENPFITSNINDLKQVMTGILRKPQILKEYSEKGIKWVKKYHGFQSVNKRLEELYIKAGII